MDQRFHSSGYLSRRGFLAAAGAAGMATMWGGAACAQTNLPNIVYILADDMGYGDVRCLNPESKLQTVQMDRLASEGMKFTDAHSGSAVCTPTRYGILTGRYCWRSTLKSSVLEGYSPPLIAKDRLTVASLLKAHGYETACIGKWHLGLGWPTTDGQEPRDKNVDYSKRIEDGPVDHGFEYFFGIPASLDMRPYLYVENDCAVEAPTESIRSSDKPAYYRAGPIAPHFKHGDVLPTLTKKAVECIDRHAKERADAPLFLYFPLNAPHTPIMPTAEFEGKSKLNAYGDFVLQVDWTVGQVLDALERNGMAENTLVVLTSDNGCSPSADFPALEKLGHHPSYHFRGHKADIFEGGHRIPFIARWPKRIAPGTVCDDLTCLTDLMATAAEIVGETLPDNAGEDSVSMLPALTGVAGRPVREAVVHLSVDGRFSLRQGDWKLELCPGSGGWSAPKDAEALKQGLPKVQLYDLREDVGERTNVEAEHPEIVERMTKLLEKYVEEGRSTPGAKQQNEGATSIWGPGKEKNGKDGK